MKSREIFQLIEKFRAADISLLEYEDSEGRLRLEKGNANREASGNVTQKSISGSDLPQDGAFQSDAARSTSRRGVDMQSGNTGSSHDAEDGGALKIKAPLVGVFYRAAAPGSEPFAEIGKEVKEGEPLCIIEAMKVMNEIKAPYDLVVKNIMGVDGEMVDFGMEIFEVEKC